MNSTFRTIFGSGIIVIGIILILDVLRIVDAGFVFTTFWPVIIILFGVFSIFDKKSSTFVGFLLVLIGLYFQLVELEIKIIQDLDLSKLIWPIIVIAIGVKILLKPRS